MQSYFKKICSPPLPSPPLLKIEPKTSNYKSPLPSPPKLSNQTDP